MKGSIATQAPDTSGIWRNRYSPVVSGDRFDVEDVAGFDQVLGRPARPPHAVNRDRARLTVLDDRARLVAIGLQTDADCGIAHIERHRQLPGLDIPVGRNVGERNAPVLAEVDRLQRAMPAVRLVIAHEPVDQRLAGHQLDLRIERRADGQASLIKLLLAVALRQFPPHFLGEEPGGNRIGRQHPRIDHQRLGARLTRLFGGDVAVLGHPADHIIATLNCPVMVAERVEGARLLRQRGQIRSFGNRQVVHRFVEVIQRGRGDSVVGEAEIDLVEVEFENLLFRIGRFDAQAQQDLTDLAIERAVGVEEEVFGHLLGDRRCALDAPGALEKDNARTHDAFRIEAPMRVKVLVLSGNEGLLDQVRNGGGREDTADAPANIPQEGCRPRHERAWSLAARSS